MNSTIWGTPRSGRGRNYPILSLFEEVNRLFDDAGTSSSEVTQRTFVPSIDLRETPTEYILHAEFPGMSKDEIIIELKDNAISVYHPMLPCGHGMIIFVSQ